MPYMERYSRRKAFLDPVMTLCRGREESRRRLEATRCRDVADVSGCLTSSAQKTIAMDVAVDQTGCRQPSAGVGSAWELAR